MVTPTVDILDRAGNLLCTITDFVSLRFAHEMQGGCSSLDVQTQQQLPRTVATAGSPGTVTYGNVTPWYEARVRMDGVLVYSGAVQKVKRDAASGLTTLTGSGWKSELKQGVGDYRRAWQYNTPRDTEGEELAGRLVGLTMLASDDVQLTTGSPDGAGSDVNGQSGEAALETVISNDDDAMWGVDENKQLYCKPMPTAVSHIVHAQGNMVNASLELDGSGIVNCVHLYGGTKNTWNRLSNANLLGVFPSYESGYVTLPGAPNNVLQSYHHLLEGWEVHMQVATGDDVDKASIANTYAAVTDRPDVWGDYGLDLLLDNTGASAGVYRVAELRQAYDKFGAGLSPNTDSGQGDCRPELDGNSGFSVNARIWQDSTGDGAQVRLTLYVYSGNTHVATCGPTAWLDLADGWNGMGADPGTKVGTDLEYAGGITVAGADRGLLMLEFRCPVNSGSQRIRVAGVQLANPDTGFSMEPWFTAGAQWEAFLAVDDSYMSGEDDAIQSSLTTYGLKLARVQADGVEGVGASQTWAKQFFYRNACPIWRGTVVAVYDAWPSYFPWDGLLRLETTDGDYQRLYSEAPGTMAATRADWTYKGGLLTCEYEVQSAGTVTGKPGSEDIRGVTLGTYPLPTVASSPWWGKGHRYFQ